MVETVQDMSSYDVDRILRSPAFGLVSTYSPDTQAKLDKYDRLRRKRVKTPAEQEELGQLSLFVKETRPYGEPPTRGSLEERVERYLEKALP